MEQLTIFYNYNKDYLNKKYLDQSTSVSVEYYSQEDCEYDPSIKKAFEEYMDNDFDYTKNDIIDIVSKIREITKRFPERLLSVSVKRKDFYEWAEYENGYFKSAGVHKTNWDDVIDVTTTSRGTNVTFKEAGFDFNSEEKITLMNEKLKPFFDKTIKLRNMARVNEFKKQISMLRDCYIEYMMEDLRRGLNLEMIEMDGFIGYLKIAYDYREIMDKESILREFGLVVDEENRTLKLIPEKDNKKTGCSKVKKTR